MTGRQPRVLLALDTSTAFNRGVILGAARRAHRIGPWRLEIAGIHGIARTAVAGVDGVIGLLRDSEHLRCLRTAGVPAVNVSSAACTADVPTAMADEPAIGALAAEHLLGLGLRRFAWCTDTLQGVPVDRLHAFAAAIARAGHVCDRFDLSAQSDPERGFLAWMAGLPRPLGLFVRKDPVGQAVLAWCRRAGIAVPEEVAVVSTDDDAVVCEICDPPLSSVGVPSEAIGDAAATLLGELLAGRAPAAGRVLVPPVGVTRRRSSDLLAVADADVAAALRLISEHAGRAFDVPRLLRGLSVSRRTLELRFRAVLGRSPAAEIRRVRLERVRVLLADTDLSVRDVARRTGFGNGKRLAAAFTRATGMTPGAYRRRLRVAADA